MLATYFGVLGFKMTAASYADVTSRRKPPPHWSDLPNGDLYYGDMALASRAERTQKSRAQGVGFVSRNKHYVYSETSSVRVRDKAPPLTTEV